MKRTLQRTALGLLIAGLAAAAGPTPLSARTRSHTAATPSCATSGLDVWFFDTPGGGTAGSFFYELKLTNLSSRTCTLTGYPGVSAVNLAGQRIGAPARREAGTTTHTVVLAPGVTASATLRIVVAGNYPASACHEVTAAGLRVYPPGQTHSRLVPVPFKACSRTGPQILLVRALSAT
jgi:Protein of unknown function (DUF4232)